jgi:hypothetical protein
MHAPGAQPIPWHQVERKLESGDVLVTSTVTSIEVNPVLDPARFGVHACETDGRPPGRTRRTSNSSSSAMNRDCARKFVGNPPFSGCGSRGRLRLLDFLAPVPVLQVQAMQA